MAAIFISVILVLVGAGGFIMFWREGGRNTVRKDDGENCSMQKTGNGGTLRDEQPATVSGGNANVVDFDPKTLPEQFRCIKCGRLVSKGEFHAARKCPDCGGGILKAVKDCSR